MILTAGAAGSIGQHWAAAFSMHFTIKIFRASGEAILGTLKLFPKRLVVGFQRKTGEQTKITTRNSSRKSKKPAKRKKGKEIVLYLKMPFFKAEQKGKLLINSQTHTLDGQR